MHCFHPVHGHDIELSRNHQEATDLDFYGPCVLFSNDPLNTGEEFSVRMLQLSTLVRCVL